MERYSTDFEIPEKFEKISLKKPFYICTINIYIYIANFEIPDREVYNRVRKVSITVFNYNETLVPINPSQFRLVSIPGTLSLCSVKLRKKKKRAYSNRATTIKIITFLIVFFFFFIAHE